MSSAAPAYHRSSQSKKWYAGAALDIPYATVS